MLCQTPADMTKGMRKQLKVQPSYGYKHPDCGMQPPPGVQPDQALQFVLQLCSWYPAKTVRGPGAASQQSGTTWQLER
jgi:hypothetical protein